MLVQMTHFVSKALSSMRNARTSEGDWLPVGNIKPEGRGPHYRKLGKRVVTQPDRSMRQVQQAQQQVDLVERMIALFGPASSRPAPF